MEAATLPVKIKTKAPVVAPLEIAGWIPFWRKERGAADALAHPDAFTEISPFAYTIKKDGMLFWSEEEIREKGIQIISLE